MTTIRASALPAYADSPRRVAAELFADELRDAGYEIRELPPTAGAAVGTAVHSAAAHVLKQRLLQGEYGRVEDGVELAMEGFRDETQAGCEWDDTTPDRRAAEYQIDRLTRAYCTWIAPRIEPVLVEEAFRADLGDDMALSGHVDVVTAEGVRDLKTGAVERSYHQQLGAYSLLVRSQENPPVSQVQALSIDWLKRAGVRKAQPEPVERRYRVAICEREAYSTIQRIQRDLAEFRRTGDASCFTCNRLSMLCASDRYCPARGTNLCENPEED